MQDSPARADARDRQLAYLAFDFVLDLAGDGIPGLKPLESLLMMAVNQANIAPLTRDPAARARHGALETPAPDEIRRPVSVRAVATSMRMPYETARRNIRRLEALGACVASEAGVVVPASFMLTPAYFEAARRGHERLFALYRALCAQALLEPLPAANYDESEPPVRGAVRLMSDFLLRSADAAVSRTGDLVSALVILPLVAAAAAADGGRPIPLSAAVLARRTRLPAETVRRHAVTLVERGLCASGRSGFSLADARLVSPLWRGLLQDNAVAVQRLYAGLAERGVVSVWERMMEARAGAA
jgi:hypothetical protein